MIYPYTHSGYSCVLSSLVHGVPQHHTSPNPAAGASRILRFLRYQPVVEAISSMQRSQVAVHKAFLHRLRNDTSFAALVVRVALETRSCAQ